MSTPPDQPDVQSQRFTPLEKKDVAVVVPTRNSGVTLRQCLESIKAQQHPCTLVVVDNGSTADTPSIASEFADVMLDTGPERSAQRNAGAAATNASLVGFIDSAMEFLPKSSPRRSAPSLPRLQPSTYPNERSARVIGPRCGPASGPSTRAVKRSKDRTTSIANSSRVPAGFDETMTGVEDWDLGMRTVEVGPQGRFNAVVTHHEGPERFLGACRRKAHYPPGVARFLANHRAHGMAVASRRPFRGNSWFC
jgi:glycosyltransferase involved in cell wall biosynthesis